jgi:hypothetical protein
MILAGYWAIGCDQFHEIPTSPRIRGSSLVFSKNLTATSPVTTPTPSVSACRNSCPNTRFSSGVRLRLGAAVDASAFPAQRSSVLFACSISFPLHSPTDALITRPSSFYKPKSCQVDNLLPGSSAIAVPLPGESPDIRSLKVGCDEYQFQILTLEVSRSMTH